MSLSKMSPKDRKRLKKAGLTTRRDRQPTTLTEKGFKSLLTLLDFQEEIAAAEEAISDGPFRRGYPPRWY